MKDFVKISFLGDIMCQKELNCAVLKKYGSYDYSECFSKFVSKESLNSSDCVVGNLETPICPDSELSIHQIVFNTPPSFLDMVNHIGVRVVSTANNHCLDQGIVGLSSTIIELDKRGISHTGKYISEAESKKILIKDISGVKFAFIACTFGTNSEVNGQLLSNDELWRVDLLKRQNKKSRLTRNAAESLITKYIPDNVPPVAIDNPIHREYVKRIKEKIHLAKEMADIVIIMPHIGGQYNPAPALYTRHTMEWLAQTEANLIVANHPHVPLGFDVKNGKLCAYSLGNFCFTPGVGYYLHNVLADLGLILHTYWSQRTKTLDHAEVELICNKVNEDGISQVWTATDYFKQIKNSIEQDRFAMEADAVMCRCAQQHWVSNKSLYPLSILEN